MVIGLMITKDEEEYFRYSILSFINIVDRFVVVDDCSYDRTKAIIETFEDKYEKFKCIHGDFNGDKARQRQVALDNSGASEGDIIFFPDGDEIFYEEQLMNFFKEFADPQYLCAQFKFHHFWKDFIHVIEGHVWDQYLQRVYKYIPGMRYDYHNSVSLADGAYLAKYAKDKGMFMQADVDVFHYSYVKPFIKIRNKIEYYLLRDCPQVDKENVREWVKKHPYFSGDFSMPRFGKNGLKCAGTADGKADTIKRFDLGHPFVMHDHPWYKLYHDYALNMNKYMEEHWQFNNHLHYPHHQERMKYTAEFLKGKCVEVGCANGDSVNYLNTFNPEITIGGVEPTDWGYHQASDKHNQKFYQAYAENLPFDENTFDTVLLSEMIEHVQNVVPVLDEAFRVASKRVVITTPAKPHPDPDHKRVITPDMMRDIIKPYSEKIQITGLTSFAQPVRRTDDETEIHFMIVVVDL